MYYNLLEVLLFGKLKSGKQTEQYLRASVWWAHSCAQSFTRHVANKIKPEYMYKCINCKECVQFMNVHKMLRKMQSNVFKINAHKEKLI